MRPRQSLKVIKLYIVYLHYIQTLNIHSVKQIIALHRLIHFHSKMNEEFHLTSDQTANGIIAIELQLYYDFKLLLFLLPIYNMIMRLLLIFNGSRPTFRLFFASSLDIFLLVSKNTISLFFLVNLFVSLLLQRRSKKKTLKNTKQEKKMYQQLAYT